MLLWIMYPDLNCLLCYNGQISRGWNRTNLMIDDNLKCRYNWYALIFLEKGDHISMVVKIQPNTVDLFANFFSPLLRPKTGCGTFFWGLFSFIARIMRAKQIVSLILYNILLPNNDAFIQSLREFAIRLNVYKILMNGYLNIASIYWQFLMTSKCYFQLPILHLSSIILYGFGSGEFGCNYFGNIDRVKGVVFDRLLYWSFWIIILGINSRWSYFLIQILSKSSYSIFGVGSFRFWLLDNHLF